MIVALLIGLIIGFILAMPPGPIAMSAIRLGLDEGRKATFEMSLGSALMDAIYCLFAIFTAKAIQSSLDSFFTQYPMVSIIFQIVVILALVFYGYKQFKDSKNVSDLNSCEIKSKPPSAIKNLFTKGPFLLGVGLALTNIANPTFLPSLAVMSAWIHKLQLFDSNIANNIMFSIAFGIGNLLWLYLLGAIISSNKHRISEQSIVKIKQFSGLTFIGFAGWIGYRVVVFTNWANLFKVLFAF